MRIVKYNRILILIFFRLSDEHIIIYSKSSLLTNFIFFSYSSYRNQHWILSWLHSERDRNRIIDQMVTEFLDETEGDILSMREFVGKQKILLYISNVSVYIEYN